MKIFFKSLNKLKTRVAQLSSNLEFSQKLNIFKFFQLFAQLLTLLSSKVSYT
jgi:hypothetical protein